MGKNLLEQIAAPENLLAAWRSVRGNIPKYRRQRAVGPDGVSLAEFEQDLRAQLSVLRDMLLKERYQPSPPAFFAIPKRGGGQRMLAILPVRDRVAQRAAQQVLEGVFEPEFLPCSFGFRPGCSIEQAVTYVQKLRREGHAWVVDGDIAACFDSLDHDLLMQFLHKRIADGRVLALLQTWLDGGVMQAGPPQRVDVQSAARGVKLQGRIGKGLNWVLDVLSRSANPLADYNDGLYGEWDEKTRQDGTDAAPDDADADGGLRGIALRQVISTGMFLGMGAVRSKVPALLSRAGGALRTTMASPAGRRLLKRGALATGGLAGLAAAAAVTALLMQRKAGRAPLGVLQGSPLSPLLANIYLHPFDASILRGGHALARFADDWVILCPSRERAEAAYNDALRALARLHLKANPEKTRLLQPGEKLEWLGAVIG